MKANKLVHPVTRMTVLEICKHMNLRITQLQAIEAILHCRGKLMEAAPEDDYSYEKLILFLQQKILILPPADLSKPLNNLQTRLPKLVSASPSHTMRHSNHSPLD